MSVYKHKQYSDEIELVGIGNAHDELMFRYIGDEFKDVFFSITRINLKKDYKKIFGTKLK